MGVKLNDRIKDDTSRKVVFDFSEDDGTPIDLTGVLIRCQFKKGNKLGVLVKSVEIGSGITVTDAVGGVFQIDEFICDFSACNYFYDIEMTFVDGSIKTYISGTMRVYQDVTN